MNATPEVPACPIKLERQAALDYNYDLERTTPGQWAAYRANTRCNGAPDCNGPAKRWVLGRVACGNPEAAIADFETSSAKPDEDS